MRQNITLTGKVAELIQDAYIVEVHQEYVTKEEVQVSLAYVYVKRGDEDAPAEGDLIHVSGRFQGTKFGYPPKVKDGTFAFVIKPYMVRVLGKAHDSRNDLFQASLLGNLGGDPVVRFTQNNVKVTSASLAVNIDLGQDGKETIWFKVTQWRGDTLERHVKGKLLLVEGNVDYDKSTGGPQTWTNKEDEVQSNFSITSFFVMGFNGGTKPKAEEAEDDIPF